MREDELERLRAARDAAYHRRDWEAQASWQKLIDAEHQLRWDAYIAQLRGVQALAPNPIPTGGGQ